MRVGIYSEPASSSLGGTEVCVAVLAEALAPFHTVEIVGHREWLRADTLSAFSGTNLSGVRMRYHPRAHNPLGDSLQPFRRYQETSLWNAVLSAPYDLFINFTHGVPPFCHARRGILVVLFPMFTPPHRAAVKEAGVWQTIRRTYSHFEWHRRLATYESTVAISSYTQKWVKSMWGGDASVIYPPADPNPVANEKRSLIASVGRFSLSGHIKCQLEMMQAFSEMRLDGWQYVSAGALGNDPEDQAYTEAVRRAATKSTATISTNVGRDELRHLYGSAKIFWHAAGLGNPESTPELNEHFGITTIEAMASGCVPIVINKGGQPEVVEHGVSGFVWDSVDELQKYTTALARDQELWQRMSAAARNRARQFDRKHYLESFFRLIGSDVATQSREHHRQ